MMPKDDYFTMGDVDPATLRTYNREEAVAEALRTECYGPWAEDVDWTEIDPEGNPHDQLNHPAR